MNHERKHMMDENHKFLMVMAKEIHTQDNAITHEPIFMVQRHRRTYGFDPSYSDNVVYVTNDEYNETDATIAPRCPKCQHVYTVAEMNADAGIAACPACRETLSDDECKKIVRDYEDCLKCPHCEEPLTKDAVDDECCQACDESFDLSDDLYLTKTAYQDTWENVQPFFTRKGAEEYLRINGHNLDGKKPPRIYVESAYRNAEWIAIRKMLMQLNLSVELVDEVIAEERTANAVKESP